MIHVSNSLFSMYRYNTFSRLPRDGNVRLESLLFCWCILSEVYSLGSRVFCWLSLMPPFHNVGFPQMLGYSWFSAHLRFENPCPPLSEGQLRPQELVCDSHGARVPPVVCSESWPSSCFPRCH